MIEPWEAVAARAQAGDQHAMNDLLRRLAGVFRKGAAKFRGHESEELVQMALVTVWRKLPAYQPPRPFGAWSKVVGRRAMLDAIKRRRDGAPLEHDATAEAADPKLRDRLPDRWQWELMRRLSNRERMLLAGRFQLNGEPVTMKQFGRLTGRTPNQIRREFRNALQRIKPVFQDLYGSLT